MTDTPRRRPAAHPRLRIAQVAERAGALLSLIVLAPIMLFIALVIKLSSPGPVLFKKRYKLPNGTTQELWTFRTAGTPGDRVPLVDRALRSGSFNELPLLLSVLTGNISFVRQPVSLPLYTRVVLYLMRKRISLIVGFLIIAGVYYWITPNPHYVVLTLCLIFAGALLLDLLLATYTNQSLI
jgi:hypothetical protein